MAISTGQVQLSNGFSISYAWLTIQTTAEFVFQFESNERFALDIQKRIANQNYILSELRELEVSQWHALCTAAGMTVYGAVALSWCKGAELNQVWEGWEQSGFPLLPKPEYERPARFINPEMLPKTQSLKEIAKVADNKSLPICAMIVALEDKPLEFDLPESQLKSAKPQLAAFLKKKMEAQGDAKPELIAIWSKTIEGTEYA